MASLHHADSAVKTPRTPSPSANGYYDPDDLSAQMMDVGQQDNQPPLSLDDELDFIEGDAATVQHFALSVSDRLSQLSRKDFAIFCNKLIGRGIPSEWIRRELKPTVNAEQKSADSGVTWTHYVDAARELGFEFRLNDLDDSIEVNGQRLSDVIEARMLSYLHAKKFRSVDVARRAFVTAAAENRFHPVKEYLHSLKWDGHDHIAHLARYFTDSHSPITYSDGTIRTAFHAFQRRWFIGAVAKVYDSRSGQNPMLVLDGNQGKGKSFYVKWLCSHLPHLHFEGAIKPEDKDYLQYLTTRWIWEVGELGATMRRADREALKAFVTLQEATYRPAYGHHVLHKPALSSFIGTVNLEGELLNDPTGHRRFWPVNVIDIDWAYTSVNIDQVWAQAYHLYRTGEPWQLSDEERQAHQVITAAYEVEDIIEGHIHDWFDVDPGNTGMFTATTKIIDVLKNSNRANVKSNDRALSMQLSITLKSMGLTKDKVGKANGYIGIRPRETD